MKQRGREHEKNGQLEKRKRETKASHNPTDVSTNFPAIGGTDPKGEVEEK
jgi:hypothetical protein